jgi:FdhD protein
VSRRVRPPFAASSPPRPGLGIPGELPNPLERIPPGADPAENRHFPRLVSKYSGGEFRMVEDACAQEEDLDVLVAGQDGYTLSRTPGDDANLVIGSLFTRSRILGPESVADLRLSRRAGRDIAEVRLADGPLQERRLLPLQDTRRERLEPQRLLALHQVFEELQVVRRRTGATHGAALFDLEGGLISFGEDVGRHNGLDKAIGGALATGRLASVSMMVLSSRLAQELVLKAVCCGVPILAGFSVATAAAVECAHCYGITLVGRMRPGSMNVYTHPWRLD